MSESIYLDVTVQPNVIYCDICGARKQLRAGRMPFSEWLLFTSSFEVEHRACKEVKDGS